ncbi:MAG: hypothetical protein ACTS2F_19605 [Thainema sp.]
MTNSSAMTLLAGFLGILEFLEFVVSPVGLVTLFGVVLFWTCQSLMEWNSAIAACLSATMSLQLYRSLDDHHS